MTSESRRRRTGGARRGLLAVAAAVVALTSAHAQQGNEQVESTRAALDKWVETRRVISQEKRNWTLARESLGDRIELVRQQIDAMREKIAETEQTIGETEGKKTELVTENERLKAASASLAEIVTAMEARTKRLLQRAPEPLQERVRPLTQRIPPDPNDTKLSLSERFMNVVGILNDCNKFDADITMASEVRTLPDGTAAEVTAVYVGLGQGYYLDAKGTVAGLGRPGADAWEWTAANGAAPAIAQVIAILKNEQPAAFVEVPVQITGGGQR